MIRVYKRTDRKDLWWVSFSYRDPITDHAKVFKRQAPPEYQSKKEAYIWGLEQLEICQTSTEAKEEKKRITLRDFSVEYLEDYSKVRHKPSVYLTYKDILNIHLVPFFGDHKLHEIEPRTVDRYVAVKKETLSVKTIKNHLGLLAAMLKVGVRWRYLKVAELPHIELPKPPPPSFDWLSREEIKRLVKVAQDNPRLATMLPFAIYTGLRVGEQLALTWADVDFEREEISIRRSYASGQTTSPKSNRHRTLPLHPVALEALRAQEPLTKPLGGLVWCLEDGAQMTKQHIRDHFKRALKEAGLRDIRWHDLRHTFASTLTSAGANLQSVQILLGHSEVRTTMRYSHLSKSDLQNAISMISETHLEPNVEPKGVPETK